MPQKDEIWRAATSGNFRRFFMSANQQDKLSLLSFRWPRRGFLVTLSLVVAVAAGVVLDRRLLFNGIPSDAGEDFRLMAQAWNLIDHYYVDRASVRHSDRKSTRLN